MAVRAPSDSVQPTTEPHHTRIAQKFTGRAASGAEHTPPPHNNPSSQEEQRQRPQATAAAGVFIGKIPRSKVHASDAAEAGGGGGGIMASNNNNNNNNNNTSPATPVPDAGDYALTEKDHADEHNQRFTAGADFQGPVKVRVLCCDV
jgi:hypothetical protein